MWKASKVKIRETLLVNRNLFLALGCWARGMR
jgi:hypothetical protein